MRKVLILFLIIITLNITGCFKRDVMENITIYTTIYPIEYVTNYLYGEHATILSIYPSNVNVNKYRLTDKQLLDYSKSELYIYNGLSYEKNYAIEMLNNNRRLKIIDASMNMDYIYQVEELWLDPSNFLMLAQNIKNGFKQYITNPYLINEINQNYEELKILISEIDANLNLITTDTNYNKLLVANDLYLFLNKYDFDVISIQEENLTDRLIADVENLIIDEEIKYIYITSEEDLNSTVLYLINNYNIEPLSFNLANNLSEEAKQERINFIDIMYHNIELIKKELYKN